MSNPNLNFTTSSCKLRRVKKLQLGVFSPECIREGSVTQKVTINGTVVPAGITKYERFENGRPVYGGVNDPRMGSFDYNSRCKTCDCTYSGSGSKVNDCPGHFGHIDLALPVYHVGFIDDVVRILRCVCYHCSRLLIDPKDLKGKRALEIRDPETRLRALHDLCRGKKKCEPGEISDMAEFMQSIGVQKDVPEDAASSSGCGGMLPTYTRKELSIEVNFPENMEDIPGTGDRRQRLPAKTAYEILKRISDADVERLGLNPKWARPEWLLVSVMPVPPPHVRPSVEAGGKRAEDDLTHVLSSIVKINVSLQNCIGKGEPPHVIEQFEQLLQFKVTAFFDNERPDMPRESQRSGRPLKTIKQRLKGKEGRLRGNLMGKRVDFSARTVITADPNLMIDQVGVPRSIALRLTTPVTVTPFNINQLRVLVERGPLEWPGASYIIRSDQRRIDLRFASKNELALEYGWIVERHLQDDDIVLFNRQPSLHKMSIMGHRAKVLDWSTFRLNLSVTTPYNADFDGDEMNLHLPQSITAKADAQELMMVPRNIVTPQSNRNVMGIVQDALLGITRMTKRDVFLDKELMMNAMMWISSWDGLLPAPAVVKPRPLWTGKQLFSLICPKLNYKGFSKNHPPAKTKNPYILYDSQVLILNGELIHGIVDKNTVGNSGGSMVHVCWLQEGWEETRRFMGEIQTVVNHWMANTSYSVGVSDTVADTATMQQIQHTLDDAKTKVQNIMERAQKGELTGQPGKSLMESFEHNVNTVLNNARETAGKAATNSLLERNAIKGTVMAGSKGSLLNISQIIACVGQQNVQGARIKYGFRQRTLPHFSKDDLGMESRGFVENSYLRGLSPSEFFFHAMGGREGCIDTAVKTSETGYVQRRLVKAMETVMARYDSTLRNSMGCVIQFLYGEDGMDAQRVEKQNFDSYLLKESAFRDRYFIDVNAENFGQIPGRVNEANEPLMYLHKDVANRCRGDRELRSMLEAEYKQLKADRAELRVVLGYRGPGEETNDSIQMPVNFDRLIWNAQRTFVADTTQPTSLHPRAVLETVDRLCKNLVVVRGDDKFSREAQANATLLFQIMIRMKLGCKRVLKEYRLNEAALNWIEGAIETEFYKAIVNPGEMCGVLAAQSIGEPATQMTLNTFHNTGISAKNVTLGVPRLNELLNVAKQVRTPSLTVYLQEEFAFDEEKCKELQSYFEFTTLGDVTQRTEIHYDPDPVTTVIAEDQDMIDLYHMVSASSETQNLSPWVLRIILNQTIFHNKKMTMQEVEDKVREFFGDNIEIIRSEDNAAELVLRVRILIAPEDRQLEAEEVGATGPEDHEFLRKMEKQLSEQLHLRGIPGIKKVYLSQKSKNIWDETVGAFESKDEYVMETDGTNLAEVLISPLVDHMRTFSNDVVEVFQVLGIEGVRSALFNELRNVLSFDGGYVNYRHIACLADCMTFSGGLMAVSRHGINRSESGPLLRASFEETVEVLMNAAMFSQFDTLNGVTENIMLGQLARVGSGIVDLLMDHDKLQYALDYGGAAQQKAGGFHADFVSSGPTPISATPMASSPFSMGGFGGIGGGATPAFGYFSPSQTPMYGMSPHYGSGAASPGPGGYMGSKSPFYSAQQQQSMGGGMGVNSFSSMRTSAMARSPGYAPMSPVYSASSQVYSPTTPLYSPTVYSPNSPSYSPSSPVYSPSSPVYSPAMAGGASPASPAGYSPSGPAYSPAGTNPAFSPASYSPLPGSGPAASPHSSNSNYPAFSPIG